MKVVFKQMVSGYTGSVDGIIFYWDPRLQRILARSKPKVRINQNHIDFGKIAKNLMGIKPAERYKDDLRTYAERTWKLPEFGGIRPLWNNLYLKVMYGMKKLDPSLDLETISRAYIQYHDLPCRSVRRAVEAGLLPPVRGYEDLNSEL
jgi:hypothetical protein